MKISISGHRRVSDVDVLIIEERMLLYVMDPEVEEIFFGGAIGVDTEALRSAIQLRRGKYPKLTGIVPDTVWAQPANAQRWLREADGVVELGNPISKLYGYDSYHFRNAQLVDRIKDCGQLSAFWSGKQKGGTWSAISVAKKLGVCWEHIPISGEER